MRELLQRGPPSLRSDGALKRYGGPVGRCSELTVAQKDDMHRSLRLYVGLLSSAAQHSPSLDSYISSVLSLPTPLIPRNDHVTFITAFYAERILDFVSQTVVRRIGRILERDSSKDSASVEDVVLALAEDDSLWIWEEKAQGFLGKARLSTGRSSQITMFEVSTFLSCLESYPDTAIALCRVHRPRRSTSYYSRLRRKQRRSLSPLRSSPGKI